MKNNKRSPFTLARQAAFCADMGFAPITPGQSLKNAIRGELEALAALSGELIGAETLDGGPMGKLDRPQSRIAMEATAQGYRENAPELYGRKIAETDFGCGYRVHRPGQSADCELDETDRALLATATHAGATNDDDKPEVETL